MSEAQQSERVNRESGLAAGLLGMLPLLLLYEVAQRSGLSWRNSSERLATLLLELLGPWEETARLAAVLAVGAVAVTVCVRDGLPLIPLLGRQLLRGAVWAMALGPILVCCLYLLDHKVAVHSSGGSPQGIEVLGAVSGAAWEELVFRVFAYGVLFLAARRLALFAGQGERAAGWTAEGVGLVGSAALFAAFHLELFSSWLGSGGEEFRAAAFTFRFIAGILLGALFRWRGPGVSAWSHGLFNMSLALGVTPGVLVQ